MASVGCRYEDLCIDVDFDVVLGCCGIHPQYWLLHDEGCPGEDDNDEGKKTKDIKEAREDDPGIKSEC